MRIRNRVYSYTCRGIQAHHQYHCSAATHKATMSSISEKLIFAPGPKKHSSAAKNNHNNNDDGGGGDNDSNHPSHHQHLGQAGQAGQADQFAYGTLHRRDLHPTSPFEQFHKWFNHPALQQVNPLSSSDTTSINVVPETCTLSTACLPSGRVSSRMVYLKELDRRGFVIYSNWGTSQKARDLGTNPHVALCFWWKPLERQVRVEGVGERLTSAESQLYFRTRARGSRIGAWASRQSEVLRPRRGEAAAATAAAVTATPATTGDGVDGQEEELGGRVDDDDDGRAQLEEQVREVEKRFEGQEDIPVPDFWGGLRVIPDMVEFWQGRESRLHDRFRYLKVPKGEGVNSGEWRIERLNP